MTKDVGFQGFLGHGASSRLSHGYHFSSEIPREADWDKAQPKPVVVSDWCPVLVHCAAPKMGFLALGGEGTEGDLLGVGWNKGGGRRSSGRSEEKKGGDHSNVPGELGDPGSSGVWGAWRPQNL